MIAVICADEALGRDVGATLGQTSQVAVARRWVELNAHARKLAHACVYVAQGVDATERAEIVKMQRHNRYLPTLLVTSQSGRNLTDLRGIALHSVIRLTNIADLRPTVRRAIATVSVTERAAQSIESDPRLDDFPTIREAFLRVLRSSGSVTSCEEIARLAAFTSAGLRKRVKELLNDDSWTPTRFKRGCIVLRAYEVLHRGIRKTGSGVAKELGIDRTTLCANVRSVLGVAFSELKRLSSTEVVNAALNEIGFGRPGLEGYEQSAEGGDDRDVRVTRA